MPSFEPHLYGQIAGMFRRMARGVGNAIILTSDGEAMLITVSRVMSMVKVIHDPTPITADIRPLLDGNGICFPDPAHIVNAKARGSLGMDDDRDNEPGVRFVVPGSYTESEEYDGRSWWPSFEEAVAIARKLQSPLDSGEGTELTGRHSREFVDLRMSTTYSPKGASSGTDQPVLRWEVFPDRVVIVAGEFGLTDAQRDVALTIDPPQEGFA